MKRRLLLVSVLTAALFAVAGLVVVVNINTILEINDIRESKEVVRHQVYIAYNRLQEAEKLLFRHQAGYEEDIDALVNAVEAFDTETAGLRRYFAGPEKPETCRRCHANLRATLDAAALSFANIQEMDARFEQRVSMMLTTSDRRQQRALEEESGRISAEILGILGTLSGSMDRMVARTEELTRALTARAKRIVLAAIVGVTLALLGVLALTIPAITRSVNMLIRGTDALAAGDLSRRVVVAGSDEIALLAARFNVMALSLEERERQLRELNRDLEKKVAERTAEIEESNLQLRKTMDVLEQVNRELSQLDRIKSDFIAIASHELRTPLAIISGYINLLREGLAGKLSPEQREVVDSAYGGTQRLARITRDLVNLSRIESGKLTARKDPVDMGEVMSESLTDQKYFIDQRRQRVTMERLENVPPVLGDRNMLVQAFINLVNNAIKFTPNGGAIVVKGRAWERGELARWLQGNRFFSDQVGALPDGAAELVEVVVEDTGVGVPPEDQKRIFSRFYEVGSSSTHSSGEFKFMGGGMGLGLSICKGIVEEHGGVIWVESSGRDLESMPGSRFHVLLPAAREAAPPAPSPPPAAVRIQRRGEGGKPLVLVVDDDEDIQRLMEAVLRGSYRVTGALGGRAGIEKARELKPDVILLDLLMTDVDGYQACRTLKADPSTARIPIILFTARAQPNEIRESLAMGAEDLLIKPFTNEELFGKIERVLRQRKETAG